MQRLVICFLITIVFFTSTSSQAQANCNRGPFNLPSNVQNNLDNNVRDWGVYCEQSPTWRLHSVSTPSVDGQSLECALTGGTVSYSNVHCYRNLTSQPNAAMFSLDLVFWFDATTCANSPTDSVVQALEFSMSKWYAGTRYEFAVQWQNVGAGAPQWRYWDPSKPELERWVPFAPAIQQCLVGKDDAGKFVHHNLRMEGAIVANQVELRSFTIDGTMHAVNLTLPTTSESGNKLAVAVQVDGNASLTPYSLFIDRVNFVRWNGLLTLTQPADNAILTTAQPIFSWTSITGAVRYELQLDRADPPQEIVTITNSAYTPTYRLCDGIYNWRVRAINSAGGASPWSQTRNLTIQATEPDTPLRNVYSTNTPTLNWSIVTWANKYDIQVDDSPSFGVPLNFEAEGDVPTVTTSPLSNCQYYWRVRAKDSGIVGDWSPIESFVVAVP